MAKKKTKKLEVKESNALIDGGSTLTLSQIKLFLFMLAEVKRSGKKKDYQVFLSDLIDIEMPKKKGRPSKHSLSTEYNKANSILKSLQKKMVTIDSKREEGLLKKRIQLIQAVTYDPKAKLGYFYFEIHKDLIPYLLDLEKRFTVYDIRNVMMCKSIYSIRIYQLLKSFEGLGEREITLEKLKSMLGVEKKYKLYGDVKRYILLKAQRELKKVSDLYFSFKEVYKGKRVHSILFTIKLKDQQRLFDGSPYPSAERALEDAKKVKTIPYDQWVSS